MTVVDIICAVITMIAGAGIVVTGIWAIRVGRSGIRHVDQVAKVGEAMAISAGAHAGQIGRLVSQLEHGGPDLYPPRAPESCETVMPRRCHDCQASDQPLIFDFTGAMPVVYLCRDRAACRARAGL